MSDTIEHWLESLGLGRYGAVFAEHEITLEALPHLTPEDLKELGLPMGPRRIVAAAAARMADAAHAGDAPRAPESQGHRGDAQRRHLTVLFCDLVGSTELSTRLDPEDMRDLLRAYQDACSRVIARYDGFVAKFMGDGVYAYFGYPRAHEDDAERAIHAAVELVATVRQIEHAGTALAVRIGIASGPVVVGDLLGQKSAEETAVTGETPNLAGRLQGLAGTNAIVVSDTTHRLAGGMFETLDLGTSALKGFAEPVRAWSVVRPRTVESRFDARRASGITELIGRGEELAALQGLWEHAKAGAGQIVLVAGEPGIGKSRLVRALQEHVSRDVHAALFYQCSPYHAGSVLHPVIERLQRAAQFEPADDAATKLDKLEAVLAPAGHDDPEAAALIAALLSLPSDGRYPPLGLAPPQQKQRTLDVLAGQILGLARHRPVLLVFEDAHWIDPTSLELLERTFARLAELPVLAVATARPEFAAPWAARPNATVLTLTRLSREDGATMVERVARGSGLPAEVLEQIAARTDGVPLFVEELTKAMLDAGALQPGAGRPGGPTPPLAIPDTLQDALMARLDRLGPGKDILQVGACIGREFSFALLAEVSRVPTAELSAALDRFADAELIERRGDPPDARYTFKHALLQDAARSSLLRTRRARMHGAIADALAATFPDVARAQPEIVAHHLTEAGALERAIPLWDQAGRDAARKFANTEAIRHFTKALDLVGSLPDGEARKRLELAVQINLAPVYMAAKGFGAPEAKAAYERARDLAQAFEDTSHLFTSIWGLWLFNQMQPRKGTARALTDELLALSTRNGDSGQVLQAHHAAWTTSFFLGDFKYAREETRRGGALYDPDEHRSHKFLYGGHDPGVCSHMFGAASAFVLGFPDQALTVMRNGLELSERMDHPLGRLLGQLWLAKIHLFRGETQDARPILELAIRLAAQAGIPRGMWASLLSGWALSGAGRATEGLAQAVTDFEAPGAAGQEAFRPYYLGLIADMSRAAGRADEGLAHVEKARALALSQDSQWCLAELHRIEGELRHARGEPPASVAPCFENALAIAREQEALSWELRAATSLGRLRRAENRPDEAHDLLAGVYGRFTEGFDTADLKDARALLDELSTRR